MELDPVLSERALGNAQRGEPLAREQPLKGEIVDRHHGGRANAQPFEIARRHGRRPVVEMQHRRRPRGVAESSGHLGGGQREPPEAHVGVGPRRSLGIRIRRARALIKLRAEKNIDDQAVLSGQAPQSTPRDFRQPGQFHDAFERRSSLDDFSIAGDQHANVGERPQRARQGRRNDAQPTDLDEIRHLRRHEKNSPAQPSERALIRPRLFFRSRLCPIPSDPFAVHRFSPPFHSSRALASGESSSSEARERATAPEKRVPPTQAAPLLWRSACARQRSPRWGWSARSPRGGGRR